MADTAPELPAGLAGFVQDDRLFHRAEAAAQRVQLALYRLIAAGLPVVRDGLALAVGRDPVEVADMLAAIPASNFLYDSGGKIVGLLGGDLEVASTCPASGTEIRLTVTPGGVTAAAPEATLLSFVTPEAARMRAELREVFCCHVNFFAGPEAAETWRANHPDAAILTLEQVFELARLRNQTGYGAVL